MRDGSKVCGTYVTYVNPTLSGRGSQSEIRSGSVIQLIGFCVKNETGKSHDLHGKIGLVSGESIFP